MRLWTFRCEEFILRLTTDPSNFDSEKFFTDPRISDFASEWKEGAPLELLHYTNNPRVADYHVHTQLRLVRQRVRLVLTWASRVLRATRTAKYPFAEDVPEWINTFFKKGLYRVRVTAFYSFAFPTYVSSLGIPMPFFGPRDKGKLRNIVGMVLSVDLKGALKATVDTRLVEGEDLIVIIAAVYKGRISRLGPTHLLPRLRDVVSDFVIRGEA